NTFFPTQPYGQQRIINFNNFGRATDNFLSYYGNASYTYRSRYTFSASGRIDHTNFFGLNTNQRAVPLYSLGASWSLSNEPFYHIDWLSYLKPRATFGYNGNINTSVSAVTTVFKELNAIY